MNATKCTITFTFYWFRHEHAAAKLLKLGLIKNQKYQWYHQASVLSQKELVNCFKAVPYLLAYNNSGIARVAEWIY